jgi:DNA-binding LacI/PurR family transcriptional regulator
MFQVFLLAPLASSPESRYLNKVGEALVRERSIGYGERGRAKKIVRRVRVELRVGTRCDHLVGIIYRENRGMPLTDRKRRVIILKPVSLAHPRIVMANFSIRDVAERAGVSRATVSRVLNGTDALVAEATRARVLAVVRELEYHPRAVARGLAGKPMNTLGVVLAYILPSVTSDPFLGPVLDGILATNKRRRQKTVIFTENDWDEALNNLPTYCDGHCDGLILVIPSLNSRIVQALKPKQVPFVVVGEHREDPDVTEVDSDNVTLAYEAVRYLAEQGHRRIAILCGNRELTSNSQRLEGYRRALAEAGIACDETLVMPGEYWEWSGEENAARLMQREPAERPTALFCSNGRIALGALRALENLNVRVPEEISVTAISETADISLARLPLTAAQMPLRQVGEQATEALLAQIHNGVAGGAKILLPGELVVRETVARFPAS